MRVEGGRSVVVGARGYAIVMSTARRGIRRGKGTFWNHAEGATATTLWIWGVQEWQRQGRHVPSLLFAHRQWQIGDNRRISPHQSVRRQRCVSRMRFSRRHTRLVFVR